MSLCTPMSSQAGKEKQNGASQSSSANLMVKIVSWSLTAAAFFSLEAFDELPEIGR